MLWYTVVFNRPAGAETAQAKTFSLCLDIIRRNRTTFSGVIAAAVHTPMNIVVVHRNGETITLDGKGEAYHPKDRRTIQNWYLEEKAEGVKSHG